MRTHAPNRIRKVALGATLTLLACVPLAWLCTGGLAETTPASSGFYLEATLAPQLTATGEVLSWTAGDPTGTYVLRRQLPGGQPRFAVVNGVAVLPAPMPGRTVLYAVRPVLGSAWSAEVTVRYPEEAAGATPPAGVAPLPASSFQPPPSSPPSLTVAGETLSYPPIEAAAGYVLQREVPGRASEYALVGGSSFQPPAIAGQTVRYSLQSLRGGAFSQPVGISYPPAPPQPASPIAPQPLVGAAAPQPLAGENAPNAMLPEVTCSLYASRLGSDSNPGSLTAPLRTVKALIRRTPAGKTGCLFSGQTFNESMNLYDGDSRGVQGAPVTITSTVPGVPATINGRVVTEPGADWLTFTGLRFRWSAAQSGLPQITVGSVHTTWRWDEVENENQTICMATIASPTWGTARHTVIDHDRIFNCGGPIPYSSAKSSGYMAHGIYVMGRATIITNDYIYHSSGRGVQLRGSQGAVVEHNVIDGNGAGMVFGDLPTDNNEVAYNIITNSTTSINRCCNVYGVYSWWNHAAPGTGNTFHNNCLYGNDGGNIEKSLGGFTATENLIANPRYLEVSTRNYALRAGSPCLGFGPDTAQPSG